MTVYRAEFTVVYMNDWSQNHRMFVAAEGICDAERKITVYQESRVERLKIRRLDFDSIVKLPRIDRTESSELGIVIWEDVPMYFRGSAPPLDWGEVFTAIISGNLLLPAEQIERICRDLGLARLDSPAPGAPVEINWIQAFPGPNGHSPQTLSRIEHWRSTGADVQSGPQEPR